MSRAPRLLLLLTLGVTAAAAQEVTFASLLDEMVDRQAICRYPEPFYLCRQFSSYDRAAKSPTEDWFANGDRGQYLRSEENEGRTEWVMVDADGPGAIVRIWSANPSGNLFFYLDGEATPRWTVDFQALTNGDGPVGQPLSAVRSRGWNCYLPIPYAKHCKITSDKNDFYYQVNYRTYAPGTPVVSFTPAQLAAESAKLAAVQAELAEPGAPTGEHTYGTVEVEANSFMTHSLAAPAGGAVLTEMRLRLLDADEETLRRTVLQATFDGEETVFVPLSDFFGSGVGANPYRGWWTEVLADGTMISRWPMPFERTARLTILNTTDQPIRIEAEARLAPFAWDDRSMHFHAAWRSEHPIDTAEKADWNYVELTGQGVYAGDSLAVMNPTAAWWGEGDEKIYLEGESFPSHFGTGTEDYYGYAWCCPDPFTAPFHAQPRCDGPGNAGHTTINRVRSLDAMPFGESLRFDMEVWHWQAVDVAYAVTTWFYGKPGLTTNREPQYEEVVRGVPQPPQPFRRPGAIEGENLEITAMSEGLEHEPQATGGYGAGEWSNETHLWVRPRGQGGFIELKVPVATPGTWQVVAYATKSWDYGIIQFSIDGRDTGVQIDCFSEQVRPTGAIDLGTHTVAGDSLTLRIEVVGANPQSRGPKCFFGLDCVVLRPAAQADAGPFGPPRRPVFGAEQPFGPPAFGGRWGQGPPRPPFGPRRDPRDDRWPPRWW